MTEYLGWAFVTIKIISILILKSHIWKSWLIEGFEELTYISPEIQSHSHLMIFFLNDKTRAEDISGSLVVKNPPANTGDTG